MTSKAQSGFSTVISIISIVLVIGVIGFIGWRLYNQQSKPTSRASNTTSSSHTNTSLSSNRSNSTINQQTPVPTNLVTDYYAPTNISFFHDRTWSYDTSGETSGYSDYPNAKSARLTLPYRETNDPVPSLYRIIFASNSTPPTTEPNLTTFTKLGQVNLGSQTLYILKAYYNASLDSNLDKVITSSCPDKACSFQLAGTNLYLYVIADKGVQAAAPLDDSMVPEITSILESMRIGKQ